MFVLLLFFLPLALSARILGIMPLPSVSHQVAVRPLWRELSLRGHQVTVLTTDPERDRALRNLTEIDLHFSYEFWARYHEDLHTPRTFWEQFSRLGKVYADLSDRQFQDEGVRRLIRQEAGFDVAIVEGIGPTAFHAFAKRFGCPLILITTVDPGSNAYHAVGAVSHPVLNPDYKLELPALGGELGLFERVKSALFVWFLKPYIRLFSTPRQQEVVEKHFGKGYSDLDEVFSNASMLFVNTNPIFHSIRPLPPNVIQIGGGGMHVQPPKPLPQELEKILNASINGFILCSFGSNTKSAYLTEKALGMIKKAFSQIPYTIIWKYELEEMPEKPDNVYIFKWLPQSDILRHPKIRLFITQGGAQSLEEAIHSHVPMLGMPFTRDQHYNTRKSEASGIGLRLDYKSLSTDSIKNAVLEIVDNPKYKRNAQHFSELMLDWPMSGLDKAVWWTEYVIRHNGAPHLRNPSLDIPTYQYYLLDIIAFLTFISATLIYLAIKLLKLISYLKSKVKQP